MSGLATASLGDEPPVKGYWAVEDIKEGMKGYGKTTLHGTDVVRFDVEVLGVQRNSSPGRDTVLVKLSGCKLEHTGIIAGMSGSPVYVDGKLLGAVAFAWPFGKEPIAGVTPFAQMVSFAGDLRNDYIADVQGARQVSTLPDLELWNAESPWLSRVPAVSGASGSTLAMSRIKMPVMISGFQSRSLAALGDHLESLDMIPVMGGSVSADIRADAMDRPLEPGSPLMIPMVTGDFDISGVGTVTHIEGDRVYGFGHPMMSLGKCEFPLMSGYIHVVFPRQTVSFKMGSPLKTLGVIDTDVSTCVAGRLGDGPRMVPMQVTVKRPRAGVREYKVAVVPHKELIASLVYTVLTGAIDTEGNLPDELTMHVNTSIQVKGRKPIEINHTYAGDQIGGALAPIAAYSIVPNLVNALARNPFSEVEIQSIQSSTEIRDGRLSADIARVRLKSDVLEPGDRLTVHVDLEPYRGIPTTRDISLDLPLNFPLGQYAAVVCDSVNSVRTELRNQPHLLQPQDLDQLFRVLELQVAERRTDLFLRVVTREVGIAMEGKAMPNLPHSMANILMSRRRTGAMPIRNELVAKVETPFVIQGAQVFQFQVVPDRKILEIGE